MFLEDESWKAKWGGKMILSRVLCCFCALLVPVLSDHWWWRVGRCHYEEVVFKSAASPWCPQFLFFSHTGLTTNYIFVTFIIVNNKNFHLEMSIFDCIEDFTKLNKKIQQRKELYCLSGFKLFNSCNQNFFPGNFCRFYLISAFTIIQTSFEMEWAGEKWAWCLVPQFGVRAKFSCNLNLSPTSLGSFAREQVKARISLGSIFLPELVLISNPFVTTCTSSSPARSHYHSKFSRNEVQEQSSICHLFTQTSFDFNVVKKQTNKVKRFKWATSALTREFWDTRPKPAYGRQDLGWDRGAMIQLRRVHFRVNIFWESLYFLRYSVSLTGGPNWPPAWESAHFFLQTLFGY